MWKNTSRWICVTSCTKYQVDILKNIRVLPFWMSKKATLFYEDFGIFPIFSCFRFGPFKNVLESFFSLLTKIWPKNMHRISKIQNFKFYLFSSWPWLTLTWHKVTKGLGGYLRHDPCHSITFISIWYGCFARWSEQRQTLKKTFDLICDVISDVQIKFRKKIGMFKPGASNAVFGSRIGPLHWFGR